MAYTTQQKIFNAIQDLNEMFLAQQARITRLENRVATLEAQNKLQEAKHARP